MATVTFYGLRLNLISDPSVKDWFPYGEPAQSQPQKQAQARPRSNGGAQLVAQRGRLAQVQYTLQAVTASQRQRIEFDWVGLPLCVRDGTGRKFFGFYTTPQITDHAYNTECDVQVTFNEITFSEAV